MYNLEYDRVNDLVRRMCLPYRREAEGSGHHRGFHQRSLFIYRKKFQKHSPRSGRMIDDLPDEFFDLSGPFSLLATRRDGTMWTGEARWSWRSY